MNGGGKGVEEEANGVASSAWECWILTEST